MIIFQTSMLNMHPSSWPVSRTSLMTPRKLYYFLYMVPKINRHSKWYKIPIFSHQSLYVMVILYIRSHQRIVVIISKSHLFFKDDLVSFLYIIPKLIRDLYHNFLNCRLDSSNFPYWFPICIILSLTIFSILNNLFSGVQKVCGQTNAHLVNV